MGDRKRRGVGDDSEAARGEVLVEELPGDRLPRSVQVLERLVEEEEPRPVEEGPAPAQALPHAGGEGAGQAVAGETHPGEELGPPRRGDAAQAAEEGEVLGGGELL